MPCLAKIYSSMTQKMVVAFLSGEKIDKDNGVIVA
jgi:hypothetical protein